MFGTRHSPMATRERLLCSIISIQMSLRLPNLITREGTLRLLVSHALFQGLIVSLSTYLWLKHEISIVLLMSLRTSGRKIFLSDHTAVRLVILKPANRGHQNKRIPSWMSKHPKIGSILQQLQDDHRFSPDPFCALAKFKVLLHKAKKMTKLELSRQTPDCIGAKFLITSTALHAYRNRHLGTLMRCCDAWKPLKIALTHFLSSVLTSSDFARIFASLTRQHLAERETEITNLPCTQTEKDIALARCTSSQRTWRNKKPCANPRCCYR